MYTLKIIWRGGPRWNPDAPSVVNSEKKKSPIEHLIETGGQTIDEAIEAFDYFKSMPIKVRQERSDDSEINWITFLDIQNQDEEKSSFIKDELIKYYSKRKDIVENNGSGYSMEILVESSVETDILYT